MQVTKAERVKQYNQANRGYNVTGIKKMTVEELQYIRLNEPKSLDELYSSYSDAKLRSYNDIMSTYKPQEIIAVRGSNHSYSVTLVAENGDILNITKSNNYLIEIV